MRPFLKPILKEVKVVNIYSSVLHNIRIIPKFDHRPLRCRECIRTNNLTTRPIYWPIIHPFHLTFSHRKNTLIVIFQFITKYATSPDPILRKIVNNLGLLEILLMDKYVEIDSDLGDINFDPNKPLPPNVVTRLYLRACHYGVNAISLFETWYEENLLQRIKSIFRP